MRRAEKPKKRGTIAYRLWLVQHYISAGENQKRAAEILGIGEKAWHSYLRMNYLSLDSANRILDKFPNLSLDWLLRGDDRALSRQVVEALKEIERDHSLPSPKGS